MSYMSNVFRDPQVPLTEGQKLIRKKVYHQITTEPDTFNMYAWEVLQSGSCGTTRCLAGWAVHFSGGKGIRRMTPTRVVREAIIALGLTEAEYYGDDEHGVVFYTDSENAYERMGRLAEDA